MEPRLEPGGERLVAILRVRISPACSMSISRQQLVAKLGKSGWSLLTGGLGPAIYRSVAYLGDSLAGEASFALTD